MHFLNRNADSRLEELCSPGDIRRDESSDIIWINTNYLPFTDFKRSEKSLREFCLPRTRRPCHKYRDCAVVRAWHATNDLRDYLTRMRFYPQDRSFG